MQVERSEWICEREENGKQNKAKTEEMTEKRQENKHVMKERHKDAECRSELKTDF